MALLSTMRGSDALADERTFSNLVLRGTQRSTMLAQSSKSMGFLHLEPMLRCGRIIPSSCRGNAFVPTCIDDSVESAGG
jgi:hypothetical protein